MAAPPKEKGFMDKLSEGISSAFNTAGTEANKAKLQTEIAMKQHQIKGIKQEFGVRGQRMKPNLSDVAAPRLGAATASQVAAWDLMARDDTAGLQALFKQRQATAQNVIGCVEIKTLRRVRPSTRRLLDSVAVPVPHCSTEPARRTRLTV